MKRLFAFFLLTTLCAFGQISVQKQSGTNVILNGAVQFGSGNTLSAVTGATVNFTGATQIGIVASSMPYMEITGVPADSILGNPTGSMANAAAITLAADLKFTGTTLDTVQPITTGSSPSFVGLTLSGAVNGITLTPTTATLNLASGSTFQTLGGFSDALTFTANTAVTFPVSGTLATTAQLPSLPLSGANGGTGVANTGLTITTAGNVSLAQALTLTGNASLTLTDSNASPVTVNLGAGGTVLYSGGSGFVSGITGTANQINPIGPSTGAVTLSLNSTIVGVNSITGTGNNDLSFTASGTNQNVDLNPSGTGALSVPINGGLFRVDSNSSQTGQTFLWLLEGTTAHTTSNYALRGDGSGNTAINAATSSQQIQFDIGMSEKMFLGASNLVVGGPSTSSAGGELQTIGAISTTVNSIATTSTDGVVLYNGTAAISGTNQWSPRLHFINQVFGSASATTDIIMESRGQTSGSNVRPLFAMAYQNSGAGYNDFFTYNGGTNTYTFSGGGPTFTAGTNANITISTGAGALLAGNETWSGTLTVTPFSTAGIVTNNASGVLASLSNASAASSTLLGFLGSGAPSSANFLRGDGTWTAVPASITVVGTPTNGQMAQWTGASSIQGLAVTGTGNAVLAAGPTLTGNVSVSTWGVNAGTITSPNGATIVDSSGTITVTANGSSQGVGLVAGASGVVSMTGNNSSATTSSIQFKNMSGSGFFPLVGAFLAPNLATTSGHGTEIVIGIDSTNAYNSAVFGINMNGTGNAASFLSIGMAGQDSNLQGFGNGDTTAGFPSLATSATHGFLFIPVSAGAPSGTPGGQTGYAPVEIDSTNHTFDYYSAGWIPVATQAGLNGTAGSASETTGTLTWTASATQARQSATVTLSANVTTFTMTGWTANMTGILEVIQPASGGPYTLGSNLPSGSKVIGGGVGSITLSTGANAIDILTVWTPDGTNFFWNYGTNYD